MSLSHNVDECMEKVANTLQTLSVNFNMTPSEIENLIIGINLEVARAYFLGARDGINNTAKFQGY